MRAQQASTDFHETNGRCLVAGADLRERFFGSEHGYRGQHGFTDTRWRKQSKYIYPACCSVSNSLWIWTSSSLGVKDRTRSVCANSAQKSRHSPVPNEYDGEAVGQTRRLRGSSQKPDPLKTFPTGKNARERACLVQVSPVGVTCSSTIATTVGNTTTGQSFYGSKVHGIK